MMYYYQQLQKCPMHSSCKSTWQHLLNHTSFASYFIFSNFIGMQIYILYTQRHTHTHKQIRNQRDVKFCSTVVFFHTDVLWVCWEFGFYNLANNKFTRLAGNLWNQSIIYLEEELFWEEGLMMMFLISILVQNQ